MTDLIDIHCHDGVQRHPELAKTPIHWRDPEPPVREDGWSGRQFRTCSYCGCIHPKDLIEALKAGARLGGSDWKYGWPHKFYVYDIPNPHEDMECKRGSSLKDGVETPIMGKVGKGHGKWYNEHLKDLSPEDFKELEEILYKHTQIQFMQGENGRLKYAAPYAGYQADPRDSL